MINFDQLLNTPRKLEFTGIIDSETQVEALDTQVDEGCLTFDQRCKLEQKRIDNFYYEILPEFVREVTKKFLEECTNEFFLEHQDKPPMMYKYQSSFTFSARYFDSFPNDPFGRWFEAIYKKDKEFVNTVKIYATSGAHDYFDSRGNLLNFFYLFDPCQCFSKDKPWYVFNEVIESLLPTADVSVHFEITKEGATAKLNILFYREKERKFKPDLKICKYVNDYQYGHPICSNPNREWLGPYCCDRNGYGCNKGCKNYKPRTPNWERKISLEERAANEAKHIRSIMNNGSLHP
jgi:hypothetical protein